MAYNKTFYTLLRKDRDDATRARIFSNWLETQPAPIQASCDLALRKLKVRWGLGDQQAKAILVQLILFLHMKVDEQDRWREHGEYVQAEFEHAFPGLKIREFLAEETPV